MKIREGPLKPDNLLDISPESMRMFAGHRSGPSLPEDIAGMVLGDIPEHFPPLVKTFVHRGLACIAYSGFYHVLATVGIGQFGMAAEAGIREYAVRNNVSLTGPKGGQRSFNTLVDLLKDAGLLTHAQSEFWTSVVWMRNSLLHPDHDLELGHGVILTNISAITQGLFELFPAPPETD